MKSTAIITLIFTLQLVFANSLDTTYTPQSPENTHIFLFGDGSVETSTTSELYANNALDGRYFLLHEMKFTLEEIQAQRRLALSFWLEEFGVDGEALEESGAALVKEYQISPQVNEKAYLINKGCHFHANGMCS
ncbi:hypothetical protein EB796_015438 [Bugula neritina]|uniref:Uncharacterized protein n=1 Tax=Bugula neritina TaxID=10212 RepID=A0A7J7JIV1_BUGNE|nr:hypothetical protein EB796_015438 [Bugula neritina]